MPHPAPPSVQELDACFFVADSTGQKLAYVYFDDEPQRRAVNKRVTKDEARRIAANVAKLPDVAIEADQLSFVRRRRLYCVESQRRR